jgi:hypothetical protein
MVIPIILGWGLNELAGYLTGSKLSVTGAGSPTITEYPTTVQPFGTESNPIPTQQKVTNTALAIGVAAVAAYVIWKEYKK